MKSSRFLHEALTRHGIKGALVAPSSRRPPDQPGI
jgi:2-succinyl-5-enolpyruvyl-6-hydroxy-3-cyclohexene-1-carboxylate synthase